MEGFSIRAADNYKGCMRAVAMGILADSRPEGFVWDLSIHWGSLGVSETKPRGFD